MSHFCASFSSTAPAYIRESAVSITAFLTSLYSILSISLDLVVSYCSSWPHFSRALLASELNQAIKYIGHRFNSVSAISYS